MTLEEIESYLINAYPGMGEPVLSEKEARIRAALVFEHMSEVRFPLHLEHWPVHHPGSRSIGIPVYRLHGSKFDLDAPDDAADVLKACGPGLDRGDLVALSRACLLGSSLIPKSWPSHFGKRLRDPDDHLAVVEELLWLGMWHSPLHVEHSYRQNSEGTKDVDWRFTSCGQMVNLEVKYRRRDWVGLVDGPFFSRDFDSYFRDVEGKFGPRREGELNVIGITTLAPPNTGLRRCIQRYLNAHPEIDAIILRSLHDPHGKTPEIHGTRKELVALFLTEEPQESQMRIASIRHLWRQSEERRAFRPGEMPSGLFESEENP